MRAAPPYFTNLGPFHALFSRGLPILMYHKLGPRPSGVRLKGLYLGESLFRRQLHQLRAAGFRSAMPGDVGANADAQPAVVITFDDGFRNVFEHGMQALVEQGFQAIEYLVAGELGGSNRWEVAEGEIPAPMMDAGQVRAWLRAGHFIGSHTLSHPWLTRLPEADAREEIAASKKRLEDAFGVAVDHFCYPYGDWNPRVRDLVQEAGYRTAVTTEFGVNDGTGDPFALRRILARYQSRSPRALWRRLQRR
ncbi:MAG TPA: polysaccharide deacetylase family protein [Nevskiaceae bacterium]